jgi:hypothetical protein
VEHEVRFSGFALYLGDYELLEERALSAHSEAPELVLTNSSQMA